MEKMERFLAASRGETVDTPPVGAWVHFGSSLWDAEVTADVHLQFFQDYDWDYIKVMNDYRFPVMGDVTEARTVEELTIVGAADLRYDNFDTQARVLQRIRAGAQGAPVVDTLFSPLQTVIRALGDSVVPLLRSDPEMAHRVLGAVADRLVEYISATAEFTDGLYFSVNGASSDWHGWGLTHEEFTQWVAPYDRRVLEAASDRVRIMHVHGYDLVPELVADYPVDVMSWSHNQSRPTLAEVAQAGKVVPMGGLDEVGSLYWPPSRVRKNVLDSRREAGDRIIVAPGCTVHSDTPPSVLRALVAAARAPLT